TTDLSAIYFDIRKDALYCDRADSARRRACRTVLDRVFQCLTAWLAPILCFTAEEAWLCRAAESGGKMEESVHLRPFPGVPDAWRDDALARRYQERIRVARLVETGALELERAAKRIGSSLQAAPKIYVDDNWRHALKGVDMAEIAVTSNSSLAPISELPHDTGFKLSGAEGIAVVVHLAEGAKCERCWKVLPEVGRPPAKPGLCLRCTEAVPR
ncbi:MAG: class I tRNA ligase family protein, partial [Rhodospirillales bacterium]